MLRRIEHPLVDLAKKNVIPIVGELQGQARRCVGLARAVRSPYNLSVADTDGRVGIDYGVYGVAEAFVIDKAGVIRFKQIGPITEDVARQDTAAGGSCGNRDNASRCDCACYWR